MTTQSPTYVQRIHVIPVEDRQTHSAQEICPCFPTEIEPFLWVHNAKDCREAKERITGKQYGPGWVNIAEYLKYPVA